MAEKVVLQLSNSIEILCTSELTLSCDLYNRGARVLRSRLHGASLAVAHMTHEFVMRSVSRAGDTYTDCVRFVHRTSLADTTVGSL
jgi:hypothetical protein